jgi:hypothetical protein
VAAAATLTVAMASRASRRVRSLVTGVLALALAFNVWVDARDYLPEAALLAGAAAGAIVVALRPIGSAPAARALAGAGALALLVVSTPGFAHRSARIAGRFRAGSHPVWMAPYTVGVLTGDRLRHRVSLVGPTESCDRIGAKAQRGSVLALRWVTTLLRSGTAARCLGVARPGGTFRLAGHEVEGGGSRTFGGPP